MRVYLSSQHTPPFVQWQLNQSTRTRATPTLAKRSLHNFFTLHLGKQYSSIIIHQSCKVSINLFKCRPCYVGLTNNVGTRMLQTTLNPFPAGTPDFVSHSVLKDYIQDTAVRTGVHEITRYDTEVKNLTKSEDKWVLEATTLKVQSPTDVSLEKTVSVCCFAFKVSSPT